MFRENAWCGESAILEWICRAQSTFSRLSEARCFSSIFKVSPKNMKNLELNRRDILEEPVV